MCPRPLPPFPPTSPRRVCLFFLKLQMQGKPPDIMGAGQERTLKGSWAGLQVKSYAGEESDTGLEKAAGRPLPNPGMRRARGRRPPPVSPQEAQRRHRRCHRAAHGPGPRSLRMNGTDGCLREKKKRAKSIRISKGRINFSIARVFKIPRKQINIHIISFFPSVNLTLT